jgi:hypothetical protein
MGKSKLDNEMSCGVNRDATSGICIQDLWKTCLSREKRLQVAETLWFYFMRVRCVLLGDMMIPSHSVNSTRIIYPIR